MEFYEVIEKRRTIRKFQGPTTEDQLNRIIQVGMKAPSRRNTQNWEIIIVDDQNIIEKIAQIKYNLNRRPIHGLENLPDREEKALRQRNSFPNASLIVIYYKKLPISWIVPFDFASVWLFIENVCLAAVAEGLGSRIATFWEEGEKEINTLLKVPEGWGLAAAISIGIPAMEPEQRNLRPIEKILHRNSFQKK